MINEGTLSITRISYGLAEIRVEGNPEAWACTRQIVQEESRLSRLPGGQIIELPFAELLAIIKHLYAIVAAHTNICINIDEETRAYIKKANQEVSQIQDTDNIPILEKQLLEALATAQWSSKRRLTEEQVRNVCSLAGLPHGASFSVPGAGKTTEALATYAFKTKTITPLFVVAPKNAFAAWEEQIGVCMPHLQVTRLVGAARIAKQLESKPQVTLITYSQLTFVEEIIMNHLANTPSFMVVDESHKIKGGDTGSWGKAILAISYLPTAKLILSGTPMPNDISDLIPQLRFLYPAISHNSDPVAAIKKVYVRTTKAELNLPPIEAKGTAIPLSDAQSELYKLCSTEIARDAEIALKSKDKSALRAFGRSYMILLQLVSNPALLAKHQNKFDNSLLSQCLAEESPKVAYIRYRARKLVEEGHKVIIWSGFVSNVETISESLSDLGADYIHGQVGTEQGSDEESSEGEHSTREGKIKRFHEDPNAMVLVANPAACSEGISLHTVCHHAIYLDRNYNAAQFLQSQDRIHRLGLAKDTETLIEYVYCPGTIDESVTRRLNWKIKQMETALDDNSIAIPTHWGSDMSETANHDDIFDLLETLRKNQP